MLKAISQPPLKVLFVTPECTPFAQVGGLGDVSAALPIALAHIGMQPTIVMPLYGCVDRSELELVSRTLPVSVGSTTMLVRVWRTLLRNLVPVLFVDYEPLFGRAGVYGPNGHDYTDNLLRFSLLSRASLELSRALALQPDVVHANDWPTALVPVHLRLLEPQERMASVLTIHNVGHQGVFPLNQVAATGLGPEALRSDCLEHFGRLNLLKGGLLHAGLLTTVSPRYAQEIQTGAFGCGLDGVVRSRAADLAGILNGVDDQWDPSADALIPCRYSAGDLAGKAVCKARLQQECGLPVRADVPVFGLVTRLTHQKGIDVFAQALSSILSLDVQVVLLGKGDAGAEDFFRIASARRPDRFHAYIGFDQGLAHRIEAGCDFFVMPSRYEPCGLNQMYSLRYGTLPIVRATGGLDDTVVNYDETTGAGTGFKLYDLYPRALFNTIGWAVSTWYNRPQHIQAMRRRAMTLDFSWERAARQYAHVYQTAVARQTSAAGQEPSPAAARVLSAC